MHDGTDICETSDWVIVLHRQACFSGKYAIISVSIFGDGALVTLCPPQRTPYACSVPVEVMSERIPSEVASRFLVELARILDMEEPTNQDQSTIRTTTLVHCCATNRRWAFETSGLPPEYIHEMARNASSAVLKKKATEWLEQRYYSNAHRVFDLLRDNFGSLFQFLA